jgi:hypothetical protein
MINVPDDLARDLAPLGPYPTADDLDAYYSAIERLATICETAVIDRLSDLAGHIRGPLDISYIRGALTTAIADVAFDAVRRRVEELREDEPREAAE